MYHNFVRILITVFTLGLLALAGCTSTAPIVSSDPNILFQDDFSNPTSGWENYQDDDGMTMYADDGYRIQVLKAGHDYWSNPGGSFSDVSIQVNATKLGGPDENDFGIICRYSDANNFYFLVAGNDGYFGVGKVLNGEQSFIGMDEWMPAASINQGDGAKNLLRADCVGDTLTFFVNGTQLIQVQDTSFANGDVGLMAGTFETPGADVLFDDFVVRKP